MSSFQVTYHGKDKVCELGGFRFSDEMVDVTDNEANKATLEEIKKNKDFTAKEVIPPPPPEQPAAKDADKHPKADAHPKAEPKKNEHHTG